MCAPEPALGDTLDPRVMALSRLLHGVPNHLASVEGRKGEAVLYLASSTGVVLRPEVIQRHTCAPDRNRGVRKHPSIR
jgi:hypothetical protein